MVWRSIKWRLQMWHGLLLLAVMAAFGYTAHELQRAGELRRVDAELKQRVGAVVNSLREPGREPPRRSPEAGPDDSPPPRPGERPRPPRREPLAPRAAGEDLVGGPAANLFANPAEGDFYYVIWGRDGLELGRSANAPLLDIAPCEADEGPRRFITRQRGVFREMTHTMPPGECILVGRSIAGELSALRQFDLWLGGLGAGVLLLGLAGGWWVAARAIRPLRDISDTAARIASGDLSQRIPAAETDSELGQLAAVLNTTFARLQDAFERQARFTADASHELRTPISVILNQTQSTLARERSAAEYRETLEACQRAAQRMRRLTETLLALARIDAGQEPLPATRLDLAALAQECLDLVRPLADERRLQLHATLQSAPVRGDPDRLALVVTNLLTNAIHHNREGGEIRITTGTHEGRATLSVADTGPGIPAEHLPHIFERFYRADPARTAAQGRSGLGLAIARAVTEAHGGTLEAQSPPGQGATFTLNLPGKAES